MGEGGTPVKQTLQIGALILRWQLTLMLIWVAFVSFHRPHLFTLIHGYAKFGTIASEAGWGWAAAVIAFGLIFMPRGSILRIIWQFATSTLFALFAILTTGQVGESYGTGVYLILSMSAGALAFVTAVQFLDTHPWERLFGWIGKLKHGR